MIGLDELVAIEEIKQLKARYFRFADTQDLENYQTLFTEDATIDVRHAVSPTQGQEPASAPSDFEKSGLIIGGRAFVDFISLVTKAGTVSVHHGHMPEIEILSPTTARGIWAMEDRVWIPDGPSSKLMHGYGHYHETYEKQSGRWLIASMKIIRLKLDLADVPDPVTGA